jgi:probable F420-dependent oxidoreductase
VQFTLEHPLGQGGCPPELLAGPGIAAFARAAEEAGFGAVAFTEHPAPSLKWLRGGGHPTLDPLAALAFCAAATSRIRLMPYLLILPYRPPLATGKTLATVDLLSEGRLVVAAGGGYLRSEFSALGVDFDERGALFDEALDVLRRVGQDSGGPDPEGLHYAGRHFAARGVVLDPPPVQHPPIWIGGNGRNARRRVVRAGQGWSPLLVSDEVAATTRMPGLATPADLAGAVRELRDMLVEAGRDPASVEVQVQSATSDVLDAGRSTEEVLDHVGQLAEAGATWFVVRPPVGTVAETVEAIDRVGALLGTARATALPERVAR